LKLEKRLHWHIDYLLREAGIAQIWYALGQHRLECTWNVIVRGFPRAISSIPGFGASDCQYSSHLTYFPTIPSFNLFQQKLRESKLRVGISFNIREARIAAPTGSPRMAIVISVAGKKRSDQLNAE
jgi:Uri superfamily endonuclease